MNELLNILARPENLVFLVPAIVAILFMLLQLVGFGADSVGGHGHGIDHHHDHDLVGSHDAGHSHDGLDHHHHHEHDHGTGHAHDHHHVDAGSQGIVSAVLTWFNVGRAPFMIIVEVLLLAFGVYGVLGTTLLARFQGASGRPAVLITAPAALVLACLTAKVVSGFFAKHLPTFESKRTTSRTLVGLTAEVASEEVTSEGGRASAKDAQGDQFTVFCQLPLGMPSVKRGEKVSIVEYDAKQDRYVVKPVAAGATAAGGAAGAKPA